MRVAATVLGAPDARALASFYRRLLGWTVADDEPDWVRLTDPDGGAGLSFQSEPDHVAPTWPTTGGEPGRPPVLPVRARSLIPRSATKRTRDP